MFPGTQSSLFPQPKPGLIVFISFLEIHDNEFIDAIQHAQPSSIFDLRLAPRFDVGRLTRETAFALFANAHAKYFDITAAVMMGKPHEEVIRQLSALLASGEIDMSRPIMFLLASPKTSIAWDSEILLLLNHAGRTPSEVVTVPSYQ